MPEPTTVWKVVEPLPIGPDGQRRKVWAECATPEAAAQAKAAVLAKRPHLVGCLFVQGEPAAEPAPAAPER